MKIKLTIKTIMFLISTINVTVNGCTIFQNKESNKFKLSIKNNDLIAEINDPYLYIKSVNISDLNIHSSIYVKPINSIRNPIIINNYKQYGLKEQKPYYFLVFQEDAKNPSKIIDGINFCFKGKKLIQEKGEIDLEAFKKKCQRL